MGIEDFHNGFDGSITFHDWQPIPGEGPQSTHLGVTGKITILSAEQSLGFEVNSRDSNWCALVEGENVSMIVPGCQIRAIHKHPLSGPQFDAVNPSFARL